MKASAVCRQLIASFGVSCAARLEWGGERQHGGDRPMSKKYGVQLKCCLLIDIDVVDELY